VPIHPLTQQLPAHLGTADKLLNVARLSAVPIDPLTQQLPAHLGTADKLLNVLWELL
jgi:hypothetical protein